MRVLTLTYPLTPVTPAACGGTEQIALQMLRGLKREREQNVTWVGAEGSAVPEFSGYFLSWNQLLAQYGLEPVRPELYSPARLAELEERLRRAAALYIGSGAFDLIHCQGFSVAELAWDLKPPVLFTLHLARRLYPPALLDRVPPNLHFQCVSVSQAQQYGARACCGIVRNGIELNAFPARRHPAGPGAPLLYLGRICYEKGAHLAIRIARRMRRPLWLVGGVHPFPDHQRYFQVEIAPALGDGIRWLAPPPLATKRRLLAQAAAVVIPSLIDETSSLVAMEASASGVPALALRVGALPEVVADGETGCLAESWEELADAAAHTLELSPRHGGIQPASCRRFAERHFCGHRMVREYAALYRRIVVGHRGAAAA